MGCPHLSNVWTGRPEANQLLGAAGVQLTARNIAIGVVLGIDHIVNLQGLLIEVVNQSAAQPTPPPRMRSTAGGGRGSQTVKEPPSLRIAITTPDLITVTSIDDSSGLTKPTTFPASHFDDEQIESIVADLVDQVIPKPKA